MNMQELYNKVATHLLTQNKKSVENYIDCKYRGDNGLKCAIGCLIPDELYTPEFEGLKLCNLPSVLLESIGINSVSCKSLASDLQTIHDHWSVNHWKSELERLAVHYDLNYAVLNDYNN